LSAYKSLFVALRTQGSNTVVQTYNESTHVSLYDR